MSFLHSFFRTIYFRSFAKVPQLLNESFSERSFFFLNKRVYNINTANPSHYTEKKIYFVISSTQNSLCFINFYENVNRRASILPLLI